MIDLRNRIRRGDLDAFDDPALPLHLLADGPTADWFWLGVVALTRRAIFWLHTHRAPNLPRADVVALGDARDDTRRLFRDDREWESHEEHGRRLLALVRRVRPLAQREPQPFDSIIDRLTRYAG